VNGLTGACVADAEPTVPGAASAGLALKTTPASTATAAIKTLILMISLSSCADAARVF
jgi:hypothetical protein